MQINGEINLADIVETRRLLEPYILATPIHLWRNRMIDDRLGKRSEIVIKFELLQHTGSFKIRGALSQMLRLSPEEAKNGVTAVSAGNHAIAVAYAGSILGIDAKVVMVKTANPARLAAAKSHGAEILLADDGPSAFAMAEQLVSSERRIFIHPFEGRNVTLGTATAGLEFLKQAGPLDVLIVAVGGGGLASGIATATKLVQPGCGVYGVEPSGAAGMHLSFVAGGPQKLDKASTIADSLAPPITLPYSYGICRALLDGLVMVEDGELRSAMRLIFRELKLAVEPACAAVIAGMLGPLRDVVAGKRVGLFFCGSNIDLESFHKHAGQHPL